MPLTVGGGFRKAEEVDAFINEGVEKICLNSILKNEIESLKKLQINLDLRVWLLVLMIRKIDNEYRIFYENGTKQSEKKLNSYLKDLENMGVGEIILTSIDNEGTRGDYDLKLYQMVDKNINIPIIANGGAKNIESYENLFKNTNLSFLRCWS